MNQTHNMAALNPRIVPWLAALLVVGCTLAAFLNSLDGEFLMDDHTEIVDNTSMESLWPPWRVMFIGHELPSRPLPYLTFAIDRTTGSKRTNAINSQLDLLYEFCQYELARRFPGQEIFTLFRGTHDASEHEVLEQVSKREQIVRLNNLVSCTAIEERAWEFGFTVWKMMAPLSKVFFFSELLPNSILKGEGEYIVIGGDYRVWQIPCTV